MQVVHCTKYLPAAGRRSTMYEVDSEAYLRQAGETHYVVLRDSCGFRISLLHSSIGVRRSILKRSENQEARTEIYAAPYWQEFPRSRI